MSTGGPQDLSGAGAPPASPEVTAVFVANRREFLSFLERRVGSPAVAEDLLQEAFVRGARSVQAHDEEPILAWFYRTLRNAAADYHRRSGAAHRALQAFAIETPTAATDPELHDTVCQCVARLADTLKPEYASALKRVEVDGVSVKDYAAEAGISPNSAGVRVFRARAALRNQVVRSCGTCAEHGCFDCTCRSG